MNVWNATLAELQSVITWDNVNNVDKEGLRPLQIACLRTFPSYEIVSFLLGKGASIDFEIRKGWTFYQELTRIVKTADQKAVWYLVNDIRTGNELKNELPVNPGPCTGALRM